MALDLINSTPLESPASPDSSVPQTPTATETLVPWLDAKPQGVPVKSYFDKAGEMDYTLTALQQTRGTFAANNTIGALASYPWKEKFGQTDDPNFNGVTFALDKGYSGDDLDRFSGAENLKAAELIDKRIKEEREGAAARDAIPGDAGAFAATLIAGALDPVNYFPGIGATRGMRYLSQATADVASASVTTLTQESGDLKDIVPVAAGHMLLAPLLNGVPSVSYGAKSAAEDLLNKEGYAVKQVDGIEWDGQGAAWADPTLNAATANEKRTKVQKAKDGIASTIGAAKGIKRSVEGLFKKEDGPKDITPGLFDNAFAFASKVNDFKTTKIVKSFVEDRILEPTSAKRSDLWQDYLSYQNWAFARAGMKARDIKTGIQVEGFGTYVSNELSEFRGDTNKRLKDLYQRTLYQSSVLTEQTTEGASALAGKVSDKAVTLYDKAAAKTAAAKEATVSGLERGAAAIRRDTAGKQIMERYGFDIYEDAPEAIAEGLLKTQTRLRQSKVDLEEDLDDLRQAVGMFESDTKLVEYVDSLAAKSPEKKRILEAYGIAGEKDPAKIKEAILGARSFAELALQVVAPKTAPAYRRASERLSDELGKVSKSTQEFIGIARVERAKSMLNAAVEKAVEIDQGPRSTLIKSILLNASTSSVLFLDDKLGNTLLGLHLKEFVDWVVNSEKNILLWGRGTPQFAEALEAAEATANYAGGKQFSSAFKDELEKLFGPNTPAPKDVAWTEEDLAEWLVKGGFPKEALLSQKSVGKAFKFTGNKIKDMYSVLKIATKLRNREFKSDVRKARLSVKDMAGRTMNFSKKGYQDLHKAFVTTYKNTNTLEELYSVLKGGSKDIYLATKEAMEKAGAVFDEYGNKVNSKIDQTERIQERLAKRQAAEEDKSLSAAEVDPSYTLEQMGLKGNNKFLKAANLTRGLTPGLRLITSSVRVIREYGEKMVQSPFQRNKNAQGIANAVSAEALSHFTQGMLARAVRSAKKDYVEYAALLSKKGAPALSRRDFDIEVGKAMARGDLARDALDTDTRAYVSKVAQAYRKEVYDPVYKKAVELDLLPPDIQREVAESYINRVYDVDRIVADENNFRGILWTYVANGLSMTLKKQAKVLDNFKQLEEQFYSMQSGFSKRMGELEKKEQKLMLSDPGAVRKELAAVRKEIKRLKKDLQDQNAAYFEAKDRATVLSDAREALAKGDSTLFDAIVKDTVDDIVQSLKSLDHSTRLGHARIKTRGPLKEIKLDIKDELIEDYLVRDIDVISRKFARVMGGEIALKQVFGTTDFSVLREEILFKFNQEHELFLEKHAMNPKFEELNKAFNEDLKHGLEDLMAMWDLIRGTYRAEVDARDSVVRRGLGAIKTFNFVTMLGGVVISSVTDLATPVLIHGIDQYWGSSLRPLISALRSPEARKWVLANYEEAANMGIATDLALNSRAASMFGVNDSHVTGNAFERFLNTTSEKFSLYSGIQHWNTLVRTAAYVATTQRIAKALKSAEDFDALIQLDKDYLTLIGIGRSEFEDFKDMLTRFGREEELDGKTVHVNNSDVWDQDLKEKWEAIVRTDVDRSVVTPTAGDLPLAFRSEWGKVIAQFQSYTVAAHQKIFLAGLQRQDAHVLQGIGVLLGAGLLTAFLKDAERFNEPDRDFEYYIKRAIDYSGLATLPVYGYDRLVDMFGGENGMVSEDAAAGKFMGPTSSSLAHVAGALRGDLADVRSLIPFNNISGIRLLFDGMQGLQ